MFDLKQIIRTWRDDPQLACVLATIVHVRGSAYRRPGARMLIREDGSRIGSVSGGCLEGDLTKKAWWWTSGDQPAVRVYDTTSDDDAVWAFGLGCNGVIEVLLERVTTPQVAATLDFLDRCHRSRQGGVIATIIRSGSDSPEVHPGQRVFLDAAKRVSSTGLPETVTATILPHMQAALRSRLSFLLKLDWADVFIEWSGAPQRLVIFGAGHDAVPLSNMAVTLGWEVCVADGRPAYARRDRFPGASEVAVIPASGDISSIHIDAETAVVMMTHNYPQDLRLLPQILSRSPRYLGLLGPRKRTDRLFGEIDVDSSDFDLHSPVGLDIGGDTAESIALSILAEAHAALSGRSGHNLRVRSGPIHEPVPEIEVNGTGRTVPQATASVPVCEISHA